MRSRDQGPGGGALGPVRRRARRVTLAVSGTAAGRRSAHGQVSSAGRYLTWGVVSISLTNLLVIVAMVVVFVLALVVPFPR